jgi:hypothetical protein
VRGGKASAFQSFEMGKTEFFRHYLTRLILYKLIMSISTTYTDTVCDFIFLLY